MKNIYKLPAYVGIILKKENHILLVQRCNTNWMSGFWNFPGGLLEENETLTAAAARETLEEMGVIVDTADFIFSHTLHVHANNQNTHDIMGFYFIAEKWNGTPINKEPHRYSDVAWFDLDKLPEHITEHALQAVESIKTGQKYFEHGW